MRQQVALARAFYGDPGLLVLDEPAAWLDHSAQQALIKAIDGARARGATVVMITHQPAFLRQANRIAVMNSGSIELIGPTEKVMAHLSGKRMTSAPEPAQATVLASPVSSPTTPPSATAGVLS
jgi:ABC-type protease/lipase transport system fused ATPase/permease subunit